MRCAGTRCVHKARYAIEKLEQPGVVFVVCEEHARTIDAFEVIRRLWYLREPNAATSD